MCDHAENNRRAAYMLREMSGKWNVDVPAVLALLEHEDRRPGTTKPETWDSRHLHDRVRETLNAKIEGYGGTMPERGIFNCHDVAALLAEIRILQAEQRPTK